MVYGSSDGGRLGVMNLSAPGQLVDRRLSVEDGLEERR